MQIQALLGENEDDVIRDSPVQCARSPDDGGVDAQVKQSKRPQAQLYNTISTPSCCREIMVTKRYYIGGCRGVWGEEEEYFSRMDRHTVQYRSSSNSIRLCSQSAIKAMMSSYHPCPRETKVQSHGDKVQESCCCCCSTRQDKGTKRKKQEGEREMVGEKESVAVERSLFSVVYRLCIFIVHLCFWHFPYVRWSVDRMVVMVGWVVSSFVFVWQ